MWVSFKLDSDGHNEYHTSDCSRTKWGRGNSCIIRLVLRKTYTEKRLKVSQLIFLSEETNKQAHTFVWFSPSLLLRLASLPMHLFSLMTVILSILSRRGRWLCCRLSPHALSIDSNPVALLASHPLIGRDWWKRITRQGFPLVHSLRSRALLCVLIRLASISHDWDLHFLSRLLCVCNVCLCISSILTQKQDRDESTS